MHIPVLLHEVIHGLNIQPTDIVVDGTVGNGGHSLEIAQLLGEKGVLIGIDHDKDALVNAQEKLHNVSPTLHLVQGNFRDITTYVQEFDIEKVDKILLDLGIRSDHVDMSGRGFTFLKDEPLVMTFNREGDGLTAREIVNEWGEETLIDIIKGYGEERYARRIAHAIVEARGEQEIETTTQLVDIIRNNVPSRYAHGPIHPATRTFQAIRIAVNDEIESLREGLEKGWDLLNENGRFAVISFHSLEDRIVKHFFKKQDNANIITKKPLYPSRAEEESNPRSRSAKLRIAEKI